MTTLRNPFSAGRWVSGPGFFCRQELIRGLLTSNEACDWVIGKRRIGKTSLLRQIEALINGEKDRGFALFWDIQGSYDAGGLTDSLIDAIEDSRDQFPEKWEETQFKTDERLPCGQILKRLSRAFHGQGGRLTLLIDEAEEFMTIGKQSPDVLSRLRKFFQSSHHVHTIISSTPRLEQLHKTIEINTSPFLHGFHAAYLGNLTRQGCVDLLKTGISKDEIIESILARTDCNPFEAQLFAKHYFERPDLERVALHLEANPSLTQVIEVNFDLLTVEEQDLLKDVFSGKTKRNQFDDTEKVLAAKMIQLGYLELEQEGELRVGSYFQKRWLQSRYNASPSFHAQHQTDQYLDSGRQNLVLKQILTLYKFFLELAQERKKLASFDKCFKVSQIDQSIYPDRTKLRLVGSDSEVPPWQSAVLETSAILKYLVPDTESWSLYRFFQIAEKGPRLYSEADFLDLMILISEEAQLD